MDSNRILASIAVGVLLSLAPAVAPALELLPTYASVYPDWADTGLGPKGEAWTYDPLAAKLTDGVYGGNDWTLDHDRWAGWQGIAYDGTGNPSAPNSYTPRNIDLYFNFAVGTTIEAVVVHTNQDAVTNWNVVTPNSAQFYWKNDSTTEALGTVKTPFSRSNSGASSGGTNTGKRNEIVFNLPQPMTATSDMYTLWIRLDNADTFGLLQPGVNSGSPYSYDGIAWDNAPGPNNGMFWIFVDEVDFYNTPVPEPSTLALMGLCLPVLLLRLRRSRRA